MKKKKQLLSALFSLALIISTLYVPVQAAEPETDTEPAESTVFCICDTLCTEDNVNGECPVCGAEGADLTRCAGTGETETDPTTETEPPAGSDPTAGTKPSPDQEDGTTGTEETQVGDTAEQPDTSDETDTAVTDVQDKINALPAADALAAMSTEEQQAVYAQVQAAYDAYSSLTDEQRAQITGTEIFDSLFAVFNSMVNALANNVTYLDAVGQTQICQSATEVTADTTTWSNGWYMVDGDITIEQRVTVTGDVHLILANNASLTVNGGIGVNGGNSLTIYAQSTDENTMGKLTAQADTENAGIGGEFMIAGGSVTINGGSVAANGGLYGAGIGGGYYGAGGSVTINGGSVTANGGYFGAGIGGGHTGAGESVTITGGSVTANGGDFGAGIGGGINRAGGSVTITGGNVTATGGNYGAGIGGGSGNSGSGGTVTINGGSVTANGGAYGAGIGVGYTGSGGTFTTEYNGNNGNAVIFATGGSSAAAISDTSRQNSWQGIIFQGTSGTVYGQQTMQQDVTIPANYTLTIPEGNTLTIPEGNTLTVAEEATLSAETGATINDNGTITGSGTLDGAGTLRLLGIGSVDSTIINKGLSIVAENIFYLDETGQGKTTSDDMEVVNVTASDNVWGADDEEEHWYVVYGNVTIGQRVTVTGDVHLILADNASLTVNGGIGVNESNSLTIYAQSTDENSMGKLTAQSFVNDNAAIGGGTHEAGGTITINGGSVKATATNGRYGAGIGGGNSGAGGTVTINGGNVTANGGIYGAGIGGGYHGAGESVTITGGSVTATGGDNGAGIGGGWNGGSGGTVTITGGSVTANGGASGAGIGGGSGGSGGTVTITGGSVTANGGTSGAGIGGGSLGSGGTFTTEYEGNNGNAVIFATGGSGAAAISDISGSDSWQGIIFQGGVGQVYGEVTLEESLTIPEGKESLTVPQGTKLTISEGVTLTVTGVTMTVNGTLTGEGEVTPRVKASLSILDTVNLDRKYNGQSITFPEGGYMYDGNGTVSISWYSSDSDGKMGDVLPGSPTDAGIYWVKLSAPETKLFTSAETVKQFNISAASLDAPSGLAWDSTTSGRAIWNAVPNASGYFVQLYRDDQAVGDAVEITGGNTTEYTFSNLTEAGSYTFTVKAKGTGNYADSSESSKSAALYTVSFRLAGSSQTIDRQLVPDGQKITKPDVSGITGLAFDGWYTDSGYSAESKWDFESSQVTEAMTLYGRFISAPTYTVTIPSTVNLGETAVISASGVNVEAGKQLEVSLTGTGSTGSAFTLESAEGATVPYAVYKGNDKINVSNTVLTVPGGEENANGSVTLSFKKPEESDVTFAGTYTGTCTFVVSMKQNAS